MGGRRRIAVAALLICPMTVLVSILILGTSSAAVAGPTVTVRPGGLLTREVKGFVPHSTITERLLGHGARRPTTKLRSNVRGVVRVRYRVPRRLGRYRLALVGAPPGKAPRGPRSLPLGKVDRSVITVGVPELVVIRIRVARPRHGSKGVAAGPGKGGGSTKGMGSGAGGTADTGVDVEALLELAGVLLAAGLVLAAGGQRWLRIRPAVRSAVHHCDS
jgi:hypothetical protein